MTTLQQAEQLLGEMTHLEKLEFLQLIAQNLSEEVSGISRTAGICGGAPRIAGTRIPVWTLVQYRKLGATDADLLHSLCSRFRRGQSQPRISRRGHPDRRQCRAANCANHQSEGFYPFAPNECSPSGDHCLYC
jgi:hypothetical protein